MFSKSITILVIDNNSPFVLPLLRSFSGYRNIHLDVLLSSEKKPHQFKYSRYLRNLYQLDELNEENFVEVVSEAVRMSKPDLVIPTREWISGLLFLNRGRLKGLVKIHPVPDTSVLEIIENKWNLNRWLKEKGFPHALNQDISKEWKSGFPVLIKPAIGIGGAGIRRISNDGELNDVLNKKEIIHDQHFLQEFLKGYDIDISLFAVEGKILFHTIQRGIISGGLVYSKGVEFIKDSTLFLLVDSIIQKLKYTGIAHLDFRFNEVSGEYVLIDFNARYWSSVQGSRAMGVNFPLLATAYSLGIDVEYPGYRTGHYYFATTALKTIVKNIFSKSRYPLRIRDTQLRYVVKDPVPEIVTILEQIAILTHKPFRKSSV